jgi:DNA-binding transcriptional LysR family regulator
VAARTGLGVLLAPEPYLPRYDLTQVRFAAALDDSALKWPSDDLWLVGHRATRDLPRVQAVWDFLAERLRALKSESVPQKKRRR